MRFGNLSLALGLMSAMLLGGPALAQRGDSDRRTDNTRNGDRDRERAERVNQNRREGAEQRRRGDQRQSQARQNQNRREPSDDQLRLAPRGWVRIGTDIDRDNEVDVWETIYYYDLVQARRTSQQRRQSRSNRGNETVDVSGTLQDIDRVNLSGQQEPEMIARIAQQDGRTGRVALGPEGKLSRLNLQEGSEVSATGRRGRINDRVMLIARQVSTDDQTVNVPRTTRPRTQRIRGEVLSTRTADFRGFDDSFVIAKVETRAGRTRTVNLGTEENVGQLNLSEGDEIAVLARQGRVNGRPALIAEQVYFDGETVRVEPPRRTSDDRAQDDRAQDDRRRNRDRQDRDRQDRDRQDRDRQDRDRR